MSETKTRAASLSHSLRGRHVAMIAIGGVIGAGLFVGSSAAIAGTGPSVLVSYALAGTVALLVMRMLGEMAIERPGEGSFIFHIRRGLGARAAFLAGWLYWLFWAVVVAAEAIGGSAILHGWIPVDRTVLGIVLVLLMAGTNLVSVRSYGEFEFWFSALKVAAILGFCGLCIAALFGLFGTGAPSVSRLWSSGVAPHGIAAVLAIVPTVMFQFTGSEIATVAASESNDPGRNVAHATNTVAARVLLFYLGSITLILCVVPWHQLVPGHSPFVAAMQALGLPGAPLAMSIIVLIAVLSCLNSSLYVTSRVLFEMAAHGDAPAALVRTGRGQVPRRAILTGTAVALCVTVASSISPDGVFAFLLNASGALILFVYLLICVAQIRLRGAMQRAGRRPAFAIWLFPFLSWATVAVIAAVLLAMAVNPATRAQIVLGTGTVLLLLALDWFTRRRHAR
ncbi:amino acid permease [Acetobacteraceae bacterium KSS8]|uniref:Amino acid permease n=1 Tax=Endosaccharibacter trunci TaxID=2812733 RepID=A0ABT1W1T2_9PROT|nr:amino acid permease [Acetobacteraceae bacterium KSS8]